MEDVIRQYGQTALNVLAAVAVLGLFIAACGGPLQEEILRLSRYLY